MCRFFEVSRSGYYNYVKRMDMPARDLVLAEKIGECQYTPAMSSKGNPYDNAMAENFFSILKTECIHRVELKTFEEARLLIGEYIRFCNKDRIQTKTKLTPLEKRSQFVA